MTWDPSHPSPTSSSSSSSSGSSAHSPRHASSKTSADDSDAASLSAQRKASTVPTASAGNDEVTQPPPKGKTPGKSHSRRGHFKSRLGCFNCKRRRVKCNEVRPSCAPCTRLGLSCSYADPKKPTTSPLTCVQINPTGLTMQDLSFFHRFMTKAFPSLPFRGDAVWLDASAMSHEVCTQISAL